jgi:hypothetical protein
MSFASAEEELHEGFAVSACGRRPEPGGGGAG